MVGFVGEGVVEFQNREPIRSSARRPTQSGSDWATRTSVDHHLRQYGL
jgi:hypothetical protein